MGKRKPIIQLTRNRALKILEDHKRDIQLFGVKKIGLFGSFLKNTAHKKSDLDILVEFKETTFDNYIELKFMLEKVFNKKVDLVIEKSLKPALKYVKEEAIYAKGL